MSTLVERLRMTRDQYGTPPEPEALEAAAEIERLKSQLAQLSEPVGACAWKPENADYGTFRTACGHTFQINEGDPHENCMAFCCYCGGHISNKDPGT